MINIELLRDVVASVVEKTLMNTGFVTYTKVMMLLAESDLTFSDCYQNPDALKSALKEVFGVKYMPIVESIRNEFGGLADDEQNLSRFLQKLGS